MSVGKVRQRGFALLLLLISGVAVSVLIVAGVKLSQKKQSTSSVGSPVNGKADARTFMVKPAQRDPKHWGSARCNDGTPFGFDLRLSPTKSSDWVIYLQGGAFCDDQAKPCDQRGTRLSSTPPEKDGSPTQIKPEGIFSTDKSINKTFANANFAYARYCSSDAWTGDTVQKRPTTGDGDGWYFSGRSNVAAMVEILKDRFGMDDTNPRTKILFSGSSAGGVGVEANADQLVKLLPNTVSRGNLKLVNDGGLIPNFDDSTHRPGSFDGPILELISIDYSFWGSKLNSYCEDDNNKNPGLCFLGANVYPYITQKPPRGLGLPILIQYSSIDKFAIELHGIDNPKDIGDAKALENFRKTSLSSFEGMNWVFSGGEQPYHTILTSPVGWKYGPKGKTFREVLTRFWQGKAPERVIFGNP